MSIVPCPSVLVTAGHQIRSRPLPVDRFEFHLAIDVVSQFYVFCARSERYVVFELKNDVEAGK